MKKIIVILVAIAVVVGAVMFYPREVDAVNEPVSEAEATPDNPATIAWVKIDSSFRVGPIGDFIFNVETISKGQYVGDGTDIPTLSIWRSFALGGGHYLWEFNFEVEAPNGKMYYQNVTQAHDLPSAGSSLKDAMGILYVSQTGTYTATMKLRAIDYQDDATGEVLATGVRSFEIPIGWAIS